MISDDMKVWWHGCWFEPGHHLFDRNGHAFTAITKSCPWYERGREGKLGGGYAPRYMHARHQLPKLADPERGDRLVFENMAGDNRDERWRIHDHSDEAPQGQFLLHQEYDCTLLAWWDRTQGDTRGACNSVFIAEGLHTVSLMLGAFPLCFPRQAARLKAAHVELVCVNKGTP